MEEGVLWGPGELQGELVEISHFVDAAGADFSGVKGQCVGWREAHRDYLVRSFEGFITAVPERFLSVYSPPAPEDGGFDAAWPEVPTAEPHFVSSVLGCLAEKGYCVVQTFLDPKSLEEAALEAEYQPDFEMLRTELTSMYLGEENTSKVALLEDIHMGADEEPGSPLGRCDRDLSLLASWLAPYGPEVLGFNTWGRTRGHVRLPCGPLVPEPLQDDDIAVGRLEEALNFARRRRLSLLHVLAGESGELWLAPREGSNLQEVKMPLASNRLYLFRHDLLSYSFRPEGPNVALQTWVLTDPPAVSLGRMEGDARRKAEIMGLKGPSCPVEGEASGIVSLMVRFPGSVCGEDQGFSMFCMGTDTSVRWPRSRWDEEPYYLDDVNATMMGKTYSVHGAFLDLKDVSTFDSSFFGIGPYEASTLAAEQRIVMETGYEAFQQAGYSKETLRGRHIGVFTGDVGSEELVPPPYTKHSAEGLSGGAMTARLSFSFGLQGPSVNHDTACSSSLMALGFAHWKLREEKASPLREALVVGVNLHMTPLRYIVLGSGGFLTRKGRCFTFDSSAEGYCRGEGCGAAMVKLCGDEADQMSRFACVAGSALNQDGRSASLTAPNGPSQQSVIKLSMRMAAVAPEMVGAAECHGTGTALGDPIEIGALLSVMKPRTLPLIFTTHKTNMGHPEANAGLAGVAKCVQLVQRSGGIPNVHLRALSPHLHTEGFPSFFVTELTDPMRTSQVAGVSSFGFGGSNARADFWGRASGGMEQVVQEGEVKEVCCPRCLGPMCWLCGMAVPRGGAQGGHRCSALREDAADYAHCSDCFRGRYAFASGGVLEEPTGAGGVVEEPMGAGGVLEEPTGARRAVYVTGTWDGWSTLHEMEQETDGVFTWTIRLGDTLRERFYLLADGEEEQALYPATDRAAASARILGPDAQRGAQTWMIDGQKDGSRAGTSYRIRLEWGAKKRRIAWEPEKAEAREQEEEDRPFLHKYCLMGSWSAWQLQAMKPSAAGGTHEASFRIGLSRQEEFQIIRDRDLAQVIYPAVDRPKDSSVPVRGPDDRGSGKNWLVRGREGETVRVRLRVEEGHLVVSVISGTDGIVTFEGAPAQLYHIVGSFNDWQFEEMVAKEGCPGTYCYQLAMGSYGCEEFQIVADEDWSQTMYPAFPEADSGEAMVQGPDDEGHGLNWMIYGSSDDRIEVTLDLHEPDRRKIVRWRVMGEFEGFE